jgi:hypothetical protein
MQHYYRAHQWNRRSFNRRHEYPTPSVELEKIVEGEILEGSIAGAWIGGRNDETGMTRMTVATPEGGEWGGGLPRPYAHAIAMTASKCSKVGMDR